MWRISQLLVFGILAGMLSCSSIAASPIERRPVSHFEVTTLDGHAIDSASLKGRVTLVHFWATWCAPCQEEMPALDKFYREHQRDGFVVIAISVDDTADEQKVREMARRFAFPVAMREAAKVDGFGRLWVVPLSFLIDRQQIVRKRDWTGPEKIDADSLERLVLPLLKEN